MNQWWLSDGTTRSSDELLDHSHWAWPFFCSHKPNGGNIFPQSSRPLYDEKKAPFGWKCLGIYTYIYIYIYIHIHHIFDSSKSSSSQVASKRSAHVASETAGHVCLQHLDDSIHFTTKLVPSLSHLNDQRGSFVFSLFLCAKLSVNSYRAFLWAEILTFLTCKGLMYLVVLLAAIFLPRQGSHILRVQELNLTMFDQCRGFGP